MLDVHGLTETLEDDPAGGVGVLSVLNCGAGDLKFRFDSGDPVEVEQARKVIEDMLKRGYTILVEVDGEYRRAKGFDPATNCYIVTEPPPPEAAAAETFGAAPEAPPIKRPRGRPRKVPAATTRATAIAPTAGG